VHGDGENVHKVRANLSAKRSKSGSTAHAVFNAVVYEVKLPRDEATQAIRHQSFIPMFSNRVISSGCFIRRMIDIAMSHSGRLAWLLSEGNFCSRHTTTALA